ncbi:MAG: DUF3365 domain-containing protein, partial [Campylobacterota bacterium]|nr:DUF3365 domain-containing protein [Campylobacterota bacterium]
MLIRIKYIIVIVMIILIDLFLFHLIERSAKEGIEYEKELLINQARAHFNDQVNTRSWNAQYGGIYVYPKENQRPNSYLLNNSIKDEDNKTMIKINPAWMTRQLSELAKIDGYHFRITSLNPLNPNNKANAFEKKALKHILESDKSEYFEFDSNEKRFQYMGALVTKAACLSCHQHQGYRIGDIRGGISVTLGSDKHFESRIAIAKRQNWQKIFVIIVSLVLGVLIIHTLQHAKILQKRVEERTKEINQTKLLLQAVLDAELSFLVVTDEYNIIYVNQTLLNFFGYSSIEEFEDNKIDITKRFEYIDENDQPQSIARNHNWIEHLLKHHNSSDIKVLIKKGRQNRFFKPHAKEICVEHKKLFLVILNEITQDLNEKRALESIASTDALTGL